MARVLDIVSAPNSRPYQLLLEIGSGGMAKVFLGRAAGAGGFERMVAVKVCHEHLTKDVEFRAMFLDEARLAARIHHPNVVPTLDVGESAELYLVMEYVEGERLAELASLQKKRSRPFPIPVALRIVVDALAGLHAAHETQNSEGEKLGIVHRDAGAHNIIVGTDGIARISDFGIAKAVSQSATTREGHVKGKLGYMPPEYLHARQVGPFTDVYAVGVVLWELLAGERLFHGETEGQTVAAVMRGEVPSLASRRDDVPEELDGAVLRAVDRDPSSRFASAALFAEALEASGSPMATTRETAAFVKELLAEHLAERRRAIREAERRATAGAQTGTGASAASAAGEIPAPAEGGAAEPADTAITAPRRWLTRAALGAPLIAILAVVLWRLMMAGEAPAAQTAQPEPAAGPAVAAAVGSTPGEDTPPMDVDAGKERDAGPSTDAAANTPSEPRNAVRSRPRRDRTKPKPKPEWQPSDI